MTLSKFTNLFTPTPEAEKKVHFVLSPVEKHELEEIRYVHFKSFTPYHQYSLNLYPARLWQPAHLRPAPGSPPDPVPDPVIRDRAQRYAEWQAQDFEAQREKGERWVKATTRDGKIIGEAGWLGPEFWEGGGVVKGRTQWTERMKEVQDVEFEAEFKGSHQALKRELFPEPKSHWYLTSLYVLPEFQGQGVGSALLLEGLRYTNGLPCFCGAFEEVAGFYEHHGFEKAGRVGAMGWINGVEREGEEKDEVFEWGLVWGRK